MKEVRNQDERDDGQDRRNEGQDMSISSQMKEIQTLKKENEALKKKSVSKEGVDLSQSKTINQLMMEQQKRATSMKISQTKLDTLMTKQATHKTMLDAMLGTKKLNEDLQTKVKLSNARITGIESTNKQLSDRMEELITVLEGMDQRIRTKPKPSSLIKHMSELKNKSQELSELCSTICSKSAEQKPRPLPKKTHKKKKSIPKPARNIPKGKGKTKKAKGK